jgi:hypothetical protein
MTEADEPLRPQLDAAIDKVRRELEILEAPSSIGGPPDDGSVIADLRKELAELEAARAGLGPYDR